MLALGYLSGCCAVQEIRYIGHHASAEEAMAEFCKRLWTYLHYDYLNHAYTYTAYKYRKVDAHYIFTGVEGYAKRSKVGQKMKYGSAFASYIMKHKLGTVIGTRLAANRMHHPDHKVAAWIWTPSPTKLKQWYTEYEKAHSKKIPEIKHGQSSEDCKRPDVSGVQTDVTD